MMIRNSCLSALLVCSTAIPPAAAEEKPPKLKALLITGGCCHDYKRQKLILSEEISKRARVEWTIVHGGKDRKTKLDVYGKKDWAKGFDVVVHNECYGSVDDVAFVEGITKAHLSGVPAVVIHCSMHTYRAAKTDEWRKFLGVTTSSHEGHRPLVVENLKPEHPILAEFPEKWNTPNGELYKIEKLWPRTTALARAFGKDTGKYHTVVWTNTYGKARVFGTTLGHDNETMSHDIYLGLVTRGLLWACGKLDEEGRPAKGYRVEGNDIKSGKKGESKEGAED